jgi:hypothetical protein
MAFFPVAVETAERLPVRSFQRWRAAAILSSRPLVDPGLLTGDQFGQVLGLLGRGGVAHDLVDAQVGVGAVAERHGTAGAAELLRREKWEGCYTWAGVWACASASARWGAGAGGGKRKRDTGQSQANASVRWC